MSAEDVIREAFVLYGRDPDDGMKSLKENLSGLSLPFDPIANSRRQDYPAIPGFDPPYPIFSYFVPESGMGTYHAETIDGRDFVYEADGHLLNFGCPLRLTRALEILSTLAPEDQKEAQEGLRSPTKHLPTVEELLWLDVWKTDAIPKRGIPTAEGKVVDWSFTSGATQVALEIKARAATWPTHSDGLTFTPRPGCFLGKASEQLPSGPHVGVLRAAAVTGLVPFGVEAEPAKNPLNQLLVHLFESELRAYPNVDVLLYRAYVGMVTVFSLDERLVRLAHSFLKPPLVTGAQVTAITVYNRKDREERVQNKPSALSKLTPATKTLNIISLECPINLSPRRFLLQEHYRISIPSRGVDGEPQFKVIPKYLPVT